MTDETPGRGDHSPTPDSISETVDNESQTHAETDTPNEMGLIKDYSQSSTSVRTTFDTQRSGEQQNTSVETTNERERDIDRPTIAQCPVPPRLSFNCEIQLPGSSSSAFRPFISDSEPIVVSPDNPKSPTQSQQPLLISTPTSRRQTIPGSTVSIPASSLSSDSPNPDQSDGVRENSSMNDDNDDGRTTASAPPCTPAPESHAQSQSPFRNSRPIKRIDLLAMSRSRQSDRAENARRDGRLAPSPRKKDEVLRNSGYLCPANRSYGFQSNLRLANNEGLISPERISNGPSSAASPQVDVVSVDDNNDASKHKMNIQFHSRDHGKCSITVLPTCIKIAFL